MSPDSFIYVADVAAVPPGTTTAFRVSGRDILICHTREEFFAVENQCSHALAKLEGGKLRAYRLICPLHGAAFDIRDGTAMGKPAVLSIRTYPLRVIDDRIEIRIEQGPAQKPGPGAAEV
ncbi:MAG: non-heme iron oxygenase ferredoxin subunit [Gammaproteobacteria bacterium]|nr:MAG: non-heme iron oxygenase ferredoxin subunit [Gammaproteobacteria bacterium]